MDVNDLTLGLDEGTEVGVYPTDWGSNHRDHGCLVALTPEGLTVAAGSRAGEVEDRIHAPRTGFSVTEIGRNGSAGSSTKL